MTRTMTTGAPRSVLRAVVVLTLGIVCAGLCCVALVRLASPFGTLGYQTDSDGIVEAVNAPSPFAAGAIRPGDRIVASATAPQYRIDVIGITVVWEPGQRVTVARARDGIIKPLTIVAAPFVLSGPARVLDVATLIAALLFIAIGAWLVLQRPSLMTWGFFIYCLTAEPAGWLAAHALPNPFGSIVAVLDIADGATGTVGLLVFALLFLSPPPLGWRRAALRGMPWLLASLLAFALFSYYRTYVIGGAPADLLARVSVATYGVLSVLVFAIFVETYFRSQGTDRQRIRWVIVGFGTSLAATFFFGLILRSAQVPDWLLFLEPLLSLIAPLTVTYAVIRHRVIDVSFVVSRALVYGALTALLVGLFTALDWFFTDWLKLTRLGIAAEIGAALLVGFWVNSLHRRVDWFIDATFFRQRHAAELALTRIAAALPFAATVQAIGECLVFEPARWMMLASAAIFRRGEGESYQRETSLGWGPDTAAQLGESDERLLMLLRSSSNPLSLYDHPSRESGLPMGPAHPVLALPILVRRELVAVVFYGAHVHGEPLDPDEVKAIGALAAGAAAAYDHLESESMRRRVEQLEGLLSRSRTQPA